jgi:uroporphyrinogen-III synthase
MALPAKTDPTPLTGKRILVTRARHQAGQLSAQLSALGAEVIEIPAIEILPPESFQSLDNALRHLQQYQWLIITSPNTVRSIRERIEHLGLSLRAFSHLKIGAIGPATAAACNEFGLSISITPEEYVAESLVAALGDQTRNARVLIARAAIARDTIPDALTQTGAQVDVVEAYRTVIPESSIARVKEVFAADHPQPDAVTFTSSSTVTNFFQMLRAAGIRQPPKRMQVISIGPITSRTLRDHEWAPAAEADPHDIPGLIAATIRTLIPNP